ncbi:MAG: hypothetical protein I3I98_07060 [Mobilibacterium timonense]|uniref:Cys-Cys-COOH (seleno)protein SaoC n=1 Tax=Mobilibacterium timonense TaxID=1871012 RepID=UPI002355ED11|nr:Cys-Cys-COOH (seleno)protein SaoC [Mobilibacterium timonense]MBM6991139.1 hypothetical protein [Mobilibacterium timonense]
MQVKDKDERKPNVKSLRRRVIAVVLVIAVIVGLAWLREYLREKEARKDRSTGGYARMVSDSNPLLEQFRKDHSGRNVILACSDDINADDKMDLVVIVKGKKSSDQNQTIVMVSDGMGYFYTDPVPAPKENQKIKFTNIDKDDDKEVMITGDKNGQVGYALFKVRGKKFRDLYGENMKDCC